MSAYNISSFSFYDKHSLKKTRTRNFSQKSLASSTWMTHSKPHGKDSSASILSNGHLNNAVSVSICTNYANNSDLHQAKQIKQGQRDIRKMISDAKMKRVTSLKNIHQSTLKDNLRNNFYITGERDILERGEGLLKGLINQEMGKQGDENIILIEPPDDEIDVNRGRCFTPDPNDPVERNKLLFNINSLFSCHREHIANFTEKTQNLARQKYLIEVKKERVQRLKEDYENKVGEVKENINFTKHLSEMLGDTIEDNLHKYFTFVLIQREKEKQELDKLTSIRAKLDIDIKKISSTISKLKSNLEKLLEYRNFLICVKERVITLPTILMSTLNGEFYENEDRLKMITPTISGLMNNLGYKKTSDRGSVNFVASSNNVSKSSNSQLYKKKMTITQRPTIFNSEQARLANHLEKFSKYLIPNHKIFDTPDDFLYEMKSLKKKSIEYINIYNDNIEKINALNKDYQKLREEEKIIENTFTKSILSKEAILKDLKDNGRRLNNELAMITSEGNLGTETNSNQTRTSLLSRHSRSKSVANVFGNTLSNFTRTNFGFYENSSIFATIQSVHSQITSLLPDLSFEQNYPSKLDENTTAKNRLREIEKVINFLLAKHNFFKNSNLHKKQLNEFEMKLDKERRYAKTRELKIKEHLRRSMIEEDIIEKGKIIIIKPKRKVVERFKPNNKKAVKAIQDSNINLSDEDFENFISYGEDNFYQPNV